MFDSDVIYVLLIFDSGVRKTRSNDFDIDPFTIRSYFQHATFCMVHELKA